MSEPSAASKNKTWERYNPETEADKSASSDRTVKG